MRLVRTATFATLVMAAVGPVSARMPATLFLAKANRLVARGPLAFLSGDLKLLQKEAEDAGDELHDEHKRRIAARQPTDWCAPATKYLAARELILGLRAIPHDKLTRLDIKEAMRLVLERNYPCRPT